MMTSARSTVQSVWAADAGGAGIGGDWLRPMPGSFRSSDVISQAQGCETWHPIRAEKKSWLVLVPIAATGTPSSKKEQRNAAPSRGMLAYLKEKSTRAPGKSARML
jgi:hypothetical protein